MAQPSYCPKHKDTLTSLNCGKCNEVVCAQCLIHTPVGVRCAGCGQGRPSPTYDVSKKLLSLAAGISICLGVTGGIGLVVLKSLGFGSPYFSILAFIGLGYVIAECVSTSTNRKRGRALQYIAASGSVLSFAIIFSFGFFTPFDIFATTIAVYLVFLRLR